MDTEHVSELLAVVISSVSVRGHVKLMTSLYACSQQSTSLLTKQAVRLGGRHNMPPPRDLDLWPFDLEVSVGVACDLGYPCAKFRLPRPFGFRVRAHVRDRQTDRRTDGRTKATLNAPYPTGGGIIKYERHRSASSWTQEVSEELYGHPKSSRWLRVTDQVNG